ncbi:MAG: thaumarchaeosortase [Candidatus Nitrosomirales archaeon]|jgi:thaumarchaeosortase
MEEKTIRGSGILQKNSSLFVTALLVSPILYTLVIAPDTFNMSWNEGRGGFLFALAFIAAELIGTKFVISKKRFLAALPLTGATMAYFTLLGFGLRSAIQDAAPVYNVRLADSWVWMWDFIVMAAYIASALTVLYGIKWLRIAPAGPIYLAGSAVILSLDAFFPYDTLGPLQFVVPYMLQVNAWFINTFGFGEAFVRENMMLLKGQHGSMALQVFWPSAGVHSMIIYTLVMMAFLLKMNIERKRKLMYFAIGVVGTVIVNMIRIFSLSLFALLISTNAAEFEEFHSIAGEIMFLPWLAAYLFLVMHLEGKRAKLRLSGATTPIS